MVTVKGMQSRFFRGFGVTYTGFVDREKGLTKPYERSTEVSWVSADAAIAFNKDLAIKSAVDLVNILL